MAMVNRCAKAFTLRVSMLFVRGFLLFSKKGAQNSIRWVYDFSKGEQIAGMIRFQRSSTKSLFVIKMLYVN